MREIIAKSNISTIDRSSRIRKIKSLLETKKNIIGQFPVIHNGQTAKYPVIYLDIDFPVYNMMNGRTMDTQEYFIKKNAKKENFFSSGQESNSAQKEQHCLLVNEADSRSKDHNVFTEFKKVKKFDPSNPIIITHDGVIINGNRRVSTMRELYYGEGGVAKYGNFESIPCAIVEKVLSEKEFTQLEDQIQIKKDLKQEYRWTNILKKIQRENKLGFTIEEIARNMGKEASEIKKSIAKLEVIDEHLDQDLDAAGDYKHVEGQEQIWNDVGSLLVSGDVKGDDDKKDIVKKITRFIAVSSNIEEKSKHDIWETLLHKKNIMTTALKIIKAHGKKTAINEDEAGSLKDAGDEVTNIANDLHSIKIKPNNKVIQNIFEELDESKKAKFVLKASTDILNKLIRINGEAIPVDDRKKIKQNLTLISSKADIFAKKIKIK